MTTITRQYAKQKPKRMAELQTYSTKPGKKDEKIVGLHVFGNLYDIDPKIATDKEFLKGVIQKAIEMAKMNLVYIRDDSFGGDKGGVSIVALITESHVVLHTWNEYKYATLDIYTCGEHSDPHAAFNFIVQELKPKNHQIFYANRSSQ